MHEHDFELIAALAEGTLGGADAAAAEAEFAACADCSAELAAQRTALEAIAAAAPAGLTMAESASLRRGVEAALGRSPVVTEAPRRRPWLALVTAGAVVVVLLAVAPLVNLLSTGSGSDAVATETTIAAEQSESLATDAAPATEAPATTSLAAAEAPTAGGDGTLEAAGDADDRGAGALPETVLSFRAPTDLDQFLDDVVAGVEGLDRIRTLTPGEIGFFRDEFEAGEAEADSGCPIEAVLAEVDGAVGLATVGTTTLDGVDLLIVVVAAPDGTQTVVALDTSSCEVVGISGDG